MTQVLIGVRHRLDDERVASRAPTPCTGRRPRPRRTRRCRWASARCRARAPISSASPGKPRPEKSIRVLRFSRADAVHERSPLEVMSILPGCAAGRIIRRQYHPSRRSPPRQAQLMCHRSPPWPRRRRRPPWCRAACARPSPRCCAAGPGHAERTRRHVLGDHTAGRRVGAVAHRDRSDQHGVRAGPHVRADDGAVLLHPVVVDDDVGRADVGLLADRGVAHIGQMRDLRPGADLGVLDLDEGADLRPARGATVPGRRYAYGPTEARGADRRPARRARGPRWRRRRPRTSMSVVSGPTTAPVADRGRCRAAGCSARSTVSRPSVTSRRSRWWPGR